MYEMKWVNTLGVNRAIIFFLKRQYRGNCQNHTGAQNCIHFIVASKRELIATVISKQATDRPAQFG